MDPYQGNYKKYSLAIALLGFVAISSVLFLTYRLFLMIGNGELVMVERNSLILYLCVVILVILFMLSVIYLSYSILNNCRKIRIGLEMSENRLRTIFENAPIGIALIDSGTGKIKDANNNYWFNSNW